MGSSSRENNQPQADQAYKNATNTANTANSEASGDRNLSTQYTTDLFGGMSKDPVTGKITAKPGTMAKFLDPNSLNVSSPTGPYAEMYTNQVAHQAIDAEHARGNLYAGLNSRGFGDAPSGAAADEMRKLYFDQAQAKGDTFSNLTDQSYQDALNNFWKASGMKGDFASGLRSNSAGLRQQAQDTYKSLYSNASQPVTTQSPWGTIAGAAIQTAGTVGTAAACPAVDSLIAMADGSHKVVEDLKKGDGIKGRSRVNFLLSDPVMVVRECVSVRAQNGMGGRVSKEHTFPVLGGGYVFAPNASAEAVLTVKGESIVTSVLEAGKIAVYMLEIDGDHSYLADGMWGLS